MSDSRQQDLQVTHGILLIIVAARVGVQSGTAGFIHADVVASFVQDRVYRCVVPDEYLISHQACLRITPVTRGDFCSCRHGSAAQPIAPEQ
jgi:hypothetical protein